MYIPETFPLGLLLKAFNIYSQLRVDSSADDKEAAIAAEYRPAGIAGWEIDVGNICSDSQTYALSHFELKTRIHGHLV